MFVFIGVNPKHVKDCYRGHVKYLKNTPDSKRAGYLPLDSNLVTKDAGDGPR